MIFFEWIVFIIGAMAFVFLPLSIIFLRLTLDRRIRRRLPVDKKYENYPDWYFGFGRTIIFGCASIWKRANNSWQINLFYDGFDVMSFANRHEKFMAYCLLLSLATLAVVGSIYFVIDLIN